MKRFRRARLVGWLLFFCSLWWISGASLLAQSGPLGAWVSSAGELIVSTPDGGLRWALTGPGERLDPALGYTWSPDGQHVFYAVDVGGVISLRFATPAAQRAYEAAQISGAALTGGAWTPDSRGVVFADGASVRFLGLDSTLTELVPNQPGIHLFTPALDPAPGLRAPRPVSPDGQFLFYQQGDGRYAIASLTGGPSFPLPGANAPNTRDSGLWADGTPLVAYWGTEGAPLLSVTNAASGQTVSLPSPSAAPLLPLLWRPGAADLIFRDAAGVVRAASLACLLALCDANPLDGAPEVLPASAQLAAADRVALYAVEGARLLAVPFACLDQGNCAGAAVVLADNVSPGADVRLGGATLAYTGFASSPADPNDQQTLFIALNGCQTTGGCAALSGGPGVTGAVAGDGSAAFVVRPGAGLGLLNLAIGAFLALDPAAALTAARWNGGL